MAFIIAEIGINHNGNVETAIKMITAASRAGADAVKFQTFHASKLEPPGARRTMLARYQLTFEDHFTLRDHARKKGVEFISTPFGVEAVEFLSKKLKLKTLKIASGNLENPPLLKAAAKSGCTILLSTGASHLLDVDRAVRSIDRKIPKYKLILMHCVSSYPAPIWDVNLSAMVDMGFQLKHDVGFSDHTDGFTAPVAAAVLGATYIEKHFTLNRNMEGPDQKVSMDPKDFEIMIKAVRDAETTYGDGIKRPMPSEAAALKVFAARRDHRNAS